MPAVTLDNKYFLFISFLLKLGQLAPLIELLQLSFFYYSRCLHGVGVEFLALDPRDKPEDDSAGRGIKT